MRIIFPTRAVPIPLGAISLLRDVDTPTLLRRGVLGLATLGIVGTGIELVFLRHWQNLTQLIAWPAILALGLALALLVRKPRPRGIQVARGIAGVVVLVAGLGIALHFYVNLNAGPLDRDYGPRWESMTSFDQWTAAITGDVGPAPMLAPGVLAEISLALLLASMRHPALRRADDMETVPSAAAA
ncbi:MAG: hypothetical protein ABI628_06675 [Chloroflexota bacterium]